MTNNNHEFRMLPIDDIQTNDWNPNEMGMFEMNQLAEDMATLGFIQPILVVPLAGGKYRVIDGAHRLEVARLCDYTEVPAVVVMSEEYVNDEDWQKFQTVRMNRLRGKFNKYKFKKLVEDLLTRHSPDEVAERLVFDDVGFIRELVEQARGSLPSENMKKEFDKHLDDVKTLDDLTTLLHRLYLKYGETLDYGYMVFDFGGKDHVWIRIPSRSDFLMIKEKAELARNTGYSFSSIIMQLIEMITETYIDSVRDRLESIYANDDELA